MASKEVEAAAAPAPSAHPMYSQPVVSDDMLPDIENMYGLTETKISENHLCFVVDTSKLGIGITPEMLSTMIKKTVRESQLTQIKIDENGNKKHYFNGELHRVDGPAVEYTNGDVEYYQFGKYHRVDGPAIIHTNGYKSWYVNGDRHRLDGPAIIRSNGDKEWLVKGKLHRIDGPAIKRANGTKEFYVNGKQIKVPEKEVEYMILPTQLYKYKCKYSYSYMDEHDYFSYGSPYNYDLVWYRHRKY